MIRFRNHLPPPQCATMQAVESLEDSTENKDENRYWHTSAPPFPHRCCAVEPTLQKLESLAARSIRFARSLLIVAPVGAVLSGTTGNTGCRVSIARGRGVQLRFSEDFCSPAELRLPHRCVCRTEWKIRSRSTAAAVWVGAGATNVYLIKSVFVR